MNKLRIFASVDIDVLYPVYLMFVYARGKKLDWYNIYTCRSVHLKETAIDKHYFPVVPYIFNL